MVHWYWSKAKPNPSSVSVNNDWITFRWNIYTFYFLLKPFLFKNLLNDWLHYIQELLKPLEIVFIMITNSEYKKSCRYWFLKNGVTLVPFVKANETNVNFPFQLKVSLNLFQRFCKVQQIVFKIVTVFNTKILYKLGKIIIYNYIAEKRFLLRFFF